jgi:mono/diheme cytochrome c family protein
MTSIPLPRALAPARTTAFALAAFVSTAAFATVEPLPPELQRGRALYDTRCIGCHDRSVHQRESRLAQDFASLRAQVIRWNANVGGEWRTEEIDLVTAFLNDRYYRYPCPAEICRTPVRASGGGPALM